MRGWQKGGQTIDSVHLWYLSEYYGSDKHKIGNIMYGFLSREWNIKLTCGLLANLVGRCLQFTSFTACRARVKDPKPYSWCDCLTRIINTWLLIGRYDLKGLLKAGIVCKGEAEKSSLLYINLLISDKISAIRTYFRPWVNLQLLSENTNFYGSS